MVNNGVIMVVANIGTTFLGLRVPAGGRGSDDANLSA
jgi:hypothetical protein